MSYKFDSLVTILNKLDSKAKITVDSLIRDLEVGKRTVHRYIDTLKTAGFPIDYDRTRMTYTFVDNFTLKKPHVSLEEALALALARKMLANFGPGMENSLGGIEQKLAVSKPLDLKHIVLSAEAVPVGAERYLASIHDAITNYRKIKITYKSFGAKKPAESTIDPYYLFFRDGNWCFRGYHPVDKAPRTFALDRIASLSILDRHYLPASVTPEEELAGAFGAFLDGEPVDVVLRFDEEYKPLILRKKWHASQQVRELADGRFDVTFTVNGTMGIRKWIYQWIPHVEVVAPKELRDLFCDGLEGTLEKHGRKMKQENPE